VDISNSLTWESSVDTRSVVASAEGATEVTGSARHEDYDYRHVRD